MDDNHFFNEDAFPGNTEIFRKLVVACGEKPIVVVTGAGISAPTLPLWPQLIRELNEKAHTEGLINNTDSEYIKNLSKSEPLMAAELLKDIYGSESLKAKVAKAFDRKNHETLVHSEIIRIDAVSHLTFNYDCGLENAFWKAHNTAPNVYNSGDAYNLQKALIQDETGLPSITHWHGAASTPESIIFTESDYSKFYASERPRAILTEMMRSYTVLFVGFSFTDPYLSRVLSQASFDSATDNQHFAILSYADKSSLSSLQRKKTSLSYRCELFIYDSSQGSHDIVLEAIKRLPKKSTTSPISEERIPSLIDQTKTQNIEEYLAEKLMTSAGVPIFIEPRFHKASDEADHDQVFHEDITDLSTDDLLSIETDLVVTAPHEYGLSTLGEILEFRSLRAGTSAVLRSAETLANYPAKLKGDLRLKGATYKTLILDDVRAVHRKLISAIYKVNLFERVVILSHDSDIVKSLDLSDSRSIQNFKLLPLTREGLRVVAEKVAQVPNLEYVPAATNKAYRDLLSLAIPLTPANVVMYLSVVLRDHAFSPLSRLHIIERYLDTRLSRASDAYAESFNSTSKIDLIANFVYGLKINNKVDFSEDEWKQFSRGYMEERLVRFDYGALLQDLEDSRIVVRSYKTNLFVFSYRIFYVYFLGKHIADRPRVLKEHIDSGEYLSVEGLVEILTGLCRDNTALLTNLTIRMENARTEFYNRYDIYPFDPHNHLKWERKPEEEERDWGLVDASLRNGPLDEKYKDQSERDFIEELRSERQGVVINQDIIAANGSISELMAPLTIATINSSDVLGPLKLRAVRSLVLAHKIAFQIACLWAVEISRSRVTVVEGMGFINMISYSETDTDESRVSLVLSLTPQAISEKIVRDLSSKKLGEIFKAIMKDDKISGIERYLSFNLLLGAKPEGWEATAVSVIEAVGNKDLYLRYIRSSLMNNFQTGINTGRELDALKRLIARIHARRDIGKDGAGPKSIEKVVRQMEKDKEFDKK